MKNKMIVLIITLICVILIAGCSSKPSSDIDNGNAQDNDIEVSNEETENQENEIDDQENGIKVSDTGVCDFDIIYLTDLDKNGNEDTIMLKRVEKFTVSVLINGCENTLEEVDGCLVHNQYWIVDIDKSDNFVEIAIKEESPPDGQLISLYRFGEGELYCIGSISTAYSEDNEKSKIVFSCETGEIIALMDSCYMVDGIYNMTYKINDMGYIESVSQDVYEYINPIETKVNRKIKVYSDKSVDSEVYEIQPEEKITVYGESDKWLLIEWNDKELWINDEEHEHFTPDFIFDIEGMRIWS